MTPATRLLGAHMPTNGGPASAILGGAEIGCTAVQLFTANPRQWTSPPLSEEDVAAFRTALADTGIAFTCSHDSYLVNLAAPDPKVYHASRRAMLDELGRCESLGIGWVVTHMGAHLGTGETEGLQKLAGAVSRLLEETDGYTAGIALETTAGQGTGLGYSLEHVAEVLQSVGDNPRLGVCVDTCHVFAAGYDLSTEDGYEAFWADFGRLIGLDKLRVIHANDAKKPLGSRIDRHEHIGKGMIGEATFRRLVRDRRLLEVPIILETPEAEKMHRVNLDLLKSFLQEE